MSRLLEDNQSVRDGTLGFALTHFSQAELQSNPLPAGRYFLATVTVTNTGGERQSFTAQNQKLIDAAGSAYPAIGMIAYSSPKDDVFVLQIDPDATVRSSSPERVKVLVELGPGGWGRRAEQPVGDQATIAPTHIATGDFTAAPPSRS